MRLSEPADARIRRGLLQIATDLEKHIFVGNTLEDKFVGFSIDDESDGSPESVFCKTSLVQGSSVPVVLTISGSSAANENPSPSIKSPELVLESELNSLKDFTIDERAAESSPISVQRDSEPAKEKGRRPKETKQDGTLAPHVMSEPIPEVNDQPVKTVVADSLREVVFNSGNNVLLEFYMPWCGHCQKLAPILDEVTVSLKDDEDVVAKMSSYTHGGHRAQAGEAGTERGEAGACREAGDGARGVGGSRRA
ncbi:hypothetical protein ABZP36_005707 [Zizania latifolia]